MTGELRRTVRGATYPWNSLDSAVSSTDLYEGRKEDQARGAPTGVPVDTPEMIRACLNCKKPECTNCFG